jgi:mRNA deadenylase 3'-5' endonuclease subunit Ccr4
MNKIKNMKDNFPFNIREWVPFVEIKKDSNIVRVVTYNILCDSLISTSADIDEYNCKNNPLYMWENRKNVILEELAQIDGDIICFQEFEKDDDILNHFAEKKFDVFNFNKVCF